MSLQSAAIALQGVGYGNAETAAQGLLDANTTAVFSADLTDGPDTLDSTVRVGSVGGGYYETKRRYVTRINGKLVEFASEAEAANALQATGQARKEIVKQAAAAVDLSAVKKLAADRMALGVFQQQLQQMQFEALMRSYEQWQDEQDIEDLMALL